MDGLVSLLATRCEVLGARVRAAQEMGLGDNDWMRAAHDEIQVLRDMLDELLRLDDEEPPS